MKIKQALKKLKKHKGKATLYSKSIHMYSQNEESLLYWTLCFTDENIMNQYRNDILKAKDWKLEKGDQ